MKFICVNLNTWINKSNICRVFKVEDEEHRIKYYARMIDGAEFLLMETMFIDNACEFEKEFGLGD